MWKTHKLKNLVWVLLLAAVFVACSDEPVQVRRYSPAELATMTQAETSQLLGTCMQAKGYVVDILPDGDLGVSPRGQSRADETQYTEDIGECRTDMGADDLLGQVENFSILKRHFTQLEKMAACLSAEGFVSGMDTPTVVEFLEGGGTNWDPYDGLSELDTVKQVAILKACPRKPLTPAIAP